MRKKYTIAIILIMVFMIVSLAGCNTSCNNKSAVSSSEEPIETTLIDGSAVTIIETEINGSKATETSVLSTTKTTTASEQNVGDNTTTAASDNDDSNKDYSAGTRSTTNTQATTESTQSNTNSTSTPKPTATPKPAATATPKPTTGGSTPTNTPKPTATPKPAATATPKPTSTPKPTNTNTPVPTATNTPVPTATPEPTATPTPESTEAPTETDPEIGYAIVKVKITASIYVDDESVETYQVVKYYEVEGYTNNYHSTNIYEYYYDGSIIGDYLIDEYGENVQGWSSSVGVYEIICFLN